MVATASLRPSRNARIRIFASRTKPQETGLPAWACKTRTQRCRHKLSPCKSAQICGDPAEFWPQRLLAFELRRWGNAARASCCRDLQQALCAEVAIERHRKARIGRGFCRSKDAPPAAKPAIPLRTLRWTLGAKRACVVIKDIEPDRLAPLAPPAPIGLRGVWVVAARSCAPARSIGELYVQAQTCSGP